jgi:hypothetical protein
MKSPQPVLLFSEASGKKTLIIKQNGFFNCAAGNNRKQTINNRGQTTFKSKDNNRQVEGSSPSRPTIYFHPNHPLTDFLCMDPRTISRRV